MTEKIVSFLWLIGGLLMAVPILALGKTDDEQTAAVGAIAGAVGGSIAGLSETGVYAVKLLHWALHEPVVEAGIAAAPGFRPMVFAIIAIVVGYWMSGKYWFCVLATSVGGFLLGISLSPFVLGV